MRNVKYMLHFNDKSSWYVSSNFLIGELIKRGVDKKDMLLYFDCMGNGKLLPFINSMKTCADIKEDTFIWHLCDFVYPRSDFYERSLSVVQDMDIVCGFCGPESKSKNKFEMVDKKDMWSSFKCIGMTNDISYKFINWFDVEILNGNSEYKRLLKEGKLSNLDIIFRDFLKSDICGDIKAYNMKPTLCQSIESITGGSFFGNDTLYFEEEIDKEFKKNVKEKYKEVIKERNKKNG